MSYSFLLLIYRRRHLFRFKPMTKPLSTEVFVQRSRLNGRQDNGSKSPQCTIRGRQDPRVTGVTLR